MLITSNPSPSMSMGIHVKVQRGRAQVMRNTGDYRQLYLTDNCRITDSWLELGPGETFASDPNERVLQLVICTSGTLKLELNSGTSVFQGQLRKMLVLDAPQASFSIKNEGSEVVRCDLNMTTQKVPV